MQSLEYVVTSIVTNASMGTCMAEAPHKPIKMCLIIDRFSARRHLFSNAGRSLQYYSFMKDRSKVALCLIFLGKSSGQRALRFLSNTNMCTIEQKVANFITML